jgi:hypothetical protein
MESFSMPCYTEKTRVLPSLPEARSQLQTCLGDFWQTKQDSEGNEENRYPIRDSNKTKINDTKEPNNAHTLKEEILPSNH